MANKFGGFGGNNMQGLMKQAQMMQQKLAEAQQELEDTLVTGTAAGEMVTVTMNGKKSVSEVKIKKEAVDPDDIEMLEDLILAAISDAEKKADELSEEIMKPFGGLGGMI
ncbi:MAG TPA: YbaB/EbfC family nucleoid-associated protein [Eubacteriales bacterium]|nr:YbaB/EbfC family nucleoid-associated protein [Eubacteriales bacterium]